MQRAQDFGASRKSTIIKDEGEETLNPFADNAASVIPLPEAAYAPRTRHSLSLTNAMEAGQLPPSPESARYGAPSPYTSSPSAFGSPAFSGGEGENGGEERAPARKLTKEEAEKLLATYAPAKKWPKVFETAPLFVKYPYLLPCCVAASVLLTGTIVFDSLKIFGVML